LGDEKTQEFKSGNQADHAVPSGPVGNQTRWTEWTRITKTAKVGTGLFIPYWHWEDRKIQLAPLVDYLVHGAGDIF